MPDVPATELHAGDLIRLANYPGEDWRVDVIHSRSHNGVVVSCYSAATHIHIRSLPISGTAHRTGTWQD